MNVSVALLDHHGDALGPPVSGRVDGGPAVLVFSVPPAVATDAHGIEGLHLRVEDTSARWDFVTGVSAYRTASPPLLDGVAGSRFDAAFGAMATSPSPSPSPSTWTR